MIPDSLLSPEPPDMRWKMLCVCFFGACAMLGYGVWAYRRSTIRWRTRSQHWFDVSMGRKPMFDSDAAGRVINDLFPRPATAKPFPGTIPWPGVNMPSIADDVQRQREWREHRALRGIDHHTRHVVADMPNCFAFDSLAAREILHFTVGGYEVEG